MYPRPKLLLSLATLMVLATLSDVALAQKGGGKTTTPKLSLTISPSTILEGNTAIGTVTHNNSSTSSAVTVTLGSSDTTEATVPASITIPAGTNSATFTVTALDDVAPDGDQTVTLAASATGYTPASATITVSDKPIIEYRTEVITVGGASIGNVAGITNNSRVYGWINDSVAGQCGFIYDQMTGTMYDLTRISALTTQVHQLAGPDFQLASIVGMNESGLMTGYIRDSAGVRLGIAVDPTVDGQFSQDPADWDIELLPDFGSTNTYGRRINEFGDILGVFDRGDGTVSGTYLFNPWLGGTPLELPLNRRTTNVELNDLGQVAGVDVLNRAFLYDALTNSTQYFADADYQIVTGINNSGVFSGNARITVPATKGKGTTTINTAFCHDGTFSQITGASNSAPAVSLNESGDVGCFAAGGISMLSHNGFSPDFNEQVFSLSKAIAADDPLKAEFVNLELNNQGPTVYAVNDRNATGYPQLVCHMSRRNPNGTLYTVAVILTPYPVP